MRTLTGRHILEKYVDLVKSWHSGKEENRSNGYDM